MPDSRDTRSVIDRVPVRTSLFLISGDYRYSSQLRARGLIDSQPLFRAATDLDQALHFLSGATNQRSARTEFIICMSTLSMTFCATPDFQLALPHLSQLFFPCSCSSQNNKGKCMREPGFSAPTPAITALTQAQPKPLLLLDNEALG